MGNGVSTNGDACVAGVFLGGLYLTENLCVIYVQMAVWRDLAVHDGLHGVCALDAFAVGQLQVDALSLAKLSEFSGI